MSTDSSSADPLPDGTRVWISASELSDTGEGPFHPSLDRDALATVLRSIRYEDQFGVYFEYMIVVDKSEPPPFGGMFHFFVEPVIRPLNLLELLADTGPHFSA